MVLYAKSFFNENFYIQIKFLCKIILKCEQFWNARSFPIEEFININNVSIQVFNTSNLEYNQFFNISSFSNEVILLRQAF